MVELIYNNESVLGFYKNSLDNADITYRLNNIETLELDLNQPPDNIIFINLVSPISDRSDYISKLEQYLEYLAAYNRKVLNGHQSINYEMNKVEQYRLLKRFGLTYPNTSFGSDSQTLLNSTSTLSMPLIAKLNRSKNGTGNQFCENYKELETYLQSINFDEVPDGILLLQEYIDPKIPEITRVLFIDYQFVYAYNITTGKETPDYNLIPDFQHQLIDKYINISKEANFDLVEFEYIQAKNSAVYTFDINCIPEYPENIEQETNHRAQKAFLDLINDQNK